MIKRVVIWLSVAGWFAQAAPCRAADQWIEVKSAHFTVVSNAGQGDARNLAWQMEQIRSALAVLWPWAHLDLDRPFIVIGVKDEASMRALAPRYWEEKNSVHPASVWVGGADRYYLAVRTDIRNEDTVNRNPYMTSYFSYVSLILRQSVPKRLPLWLERGLAEVLSNTVVREQLVLVGPVIPGNINEFRDGGRFRLTELVSMTDRSPAFRGDDAVRKFDAQSWALVHMLWFGDKGAHSAGLQHFMDAVLAGGNPDPAFREALGSPEALEESLNVYVGRNVFSFQQLQVDASVKREAFPVRPLALSESASLRALFHTAMNRPADARAAMADARKAGPSPDADVAEGLLLEREGKTDEAQAAYQRAVDAGSTSPFAYRRLASLLWQHQPDHDQLVRIEAFLAKATEQNVRDDYAYAMRGEARSELGEHDGLGLVRRAISLAPQEAEHHLSAARVLARDRNFDEAQKEVQTALALAQSDEERQRAHSLAQWLDTARGRGDR
jgi:tetratricopeptide (TPR) repeat protein